MKIRYFAQKHPSINTSIVAEDENTIAINGSSFSFGPEDGEATEIFKESSGAIFAAKRSGGVLYLDILRQFIDTDQPWNDQRYHDLNPGDTE